MDTLGQRIKKIRNMRGLTQKALALKAGISEITIQSYELEIRRPKPEQLNKIAMALDVDIAFLMPCKIDSRMAFMALMFDLIDEYGNIVIENKGGTILFGIDHLNNMRENLQLAEAKSAYDKLSVEEFKEWLINYPPKIHNGEIEEK